MVVSCGHCGAPLELEESKTVIECNFCQKKNLVADLKAAAKKPAREPAVVPIPGTGARVPPLDPKTIEYASVEPRGPTRWGRVFGVLLVLGLIIGGVVYFTQTQGSTVEEIGNLPLDSTPEEIDKKLDVTWNTGTTKRVTLRAGAPAGIYEHIIYNWDDNDFSLPAYINFMVREGSKPDPKVIAALTKTFPKIDKGSWAWGPSRISIDLETGAIHLSVKSKLDDDRPNPLRKRQLTALWQIARSAAFGGPEVPRADIVTLFGGGYPLSKLASFDPTMKFAQARTMVPMTFPGTLVEHATAHEVALDHPHLVAVSLTWDNSADGRLSGVHFRVAPTFRAQVKAFIACLTKELGPPEVTVSDFSKGTTSTNFRVRTEMPGQGLDMHVGDEANLYFVASGSSFEPVTWGRSFSAIDRCR